MQASPGAYRAALIPLCNVSNSCHVWAPYLSLKGQHVSVTLSQQPKLSGLWPFTCASHPKAMLLYVQKELSGSCPELKGSSSFSTADYTALHLLAGCSFTASDVPLHISATLLFEGERSAFFECGFDRAPVQYLEVRALVGAIMKAVRSPVVRCQSVHCAQDTHDLSNPQ